MIRGGACVALALLAAAGGCRYARPIPVSPAAADSASGRCMANACALDLANESGAPIDVSVLDGNGNAIALGRLGPGVHGTLKITIAVPRTTTVRVTQGKATYAARVTLGTPTFRALEFPDDFAVDRTLKGTVP